VIAPSAKVHRNGNIRFFEACARNPDAGTAYISRPQVASLGANVGSLEQHHVEFLKSGGRCTRRVSSNSHLLGMVRLAAEK
jgi:hypothetical protein